MTMYSVLKSKWEVNISKRVYKRTLEKMCNHVHVNCFSRDKNRQISNTIKRWYIGNGQKCVCFTQCNTGAVFLTVTGYYCCESDFKNPSPAVSVGLRNNVILLLKMQVFTGILVRKEGCGRQLAYLLIHSH